MPSITDDISSKALADAKDSAIKTARSAPSTIKGLCLILNDVTEFTAENVMVAVKNKVYQKTGNIKYSANNINISKLAESGKIHKIDDGITAEVMQHFDAQCKKYGIKYSAMLDERNPDKLSYMVFFEGKDSNLILHVMEESYKDYIKAKAVENGEKKSPDKEKSRGKSKKRDSVKAKLAFFRDRVAARDRERQEDIREKNYSHSDPQR